MDQYRILSDASYNIENKKVKLNTRIENTDYIVLDTIDTNKD
ncbi:hypothetical protein ACSFB8_04740 [Enterococcus faecalis]